MNTSRLFTKCHSYLVRLVSLLCSKCHRYLVNVIGTSKCHCYLVNVIGIFSKSDWSEEVQHPCAFHVKKKKFGGDVS